MIIVGLFGCDDCKEYFKLHPKYTYVELKRDVKHISTPEILSIKKALTKLKFDMKFPALLNDDMTELTPRNILVQELKNNESKCKTCKGK